MARPKKKDRYLEFNGEYFSQEPETGYWQNTKTRERMHRYVWRHYYGEIPKGFHVHHIDGNKSNNDISNLTLLTHSAHMKLHGANLSPEMLKKRQENCDRIRGLTKAWHASDEGRAWHKQQYEKTKDKLHVEKEFVCENCGKKFRATNVGLNRFCCNACKSQWRRKMGLDNVTRICAHCGKEFTVNKYSKAKCCSLSCANKFRFNI